MPRRVTMATTWQKDEGGARLQRSATTAILPITSVKEEPNGSTSTETSPQPG